MIRNQASNLVEHYRQTVIREGRRSDKNQIAVVTHFDRLINELRVATQPRRLFRLKRIKQPLGIYLWGDVGRGKTWLMDFFYNNCQSWPKTRYHFHRFMQEIHQRMAAVERRSNPLQRIAREIASGTRVLCLDEFNVLDIGDALILAGLLEALIDEGVILVTTSNIPPDELYKNGIQRTSFIPAIELLKQHTEVVELKGNLDYRRNILERSGVYHFPLDEVSEIALAEEFIRLASGRVEGEGHFKIMGREIPIQRIADGVIWFEFDDICGSQRSQIDYIEIAREFHTVFLSNIPRLDGSRDDQARRFIMLIDEFYDRKVKVIVSAETDPEHLYFGESLAFEFVRTASRLQEMQTEKYLSQSHLG